jgi:diacylglycerol kinase
LKYSKPKSGNIFKLIIRDIVGSNRGLLIVFKESSTVHKLIPLEFGVGLVGGILAKFIALEYIILLVTLVMIFTTEVINSAIEEVNGLVTEEKKRTRSSQQGPRIRECLSVASVLHYCISLLPDLPPDSFRLVDTNNPRLRRGFVICSPK